MDPHFLQWLALVLKCEHACPDFPLQMRSSMDGGESHTYREYGPSGIWIIKRCRISFRISKMVHTCHQPHCTTSTEIHSATSPLPEISPTVYVTQIVNSHTAPLPYMWPRNMHMPHLLPQIWLKILLLAIHVDLHPTRKTAVGFMLMIRIHLGTIVVQNSNIFVVYT